MDMKRMKYLSLLWMLTSSFSFTSCSKDDTTPVEPTVIPGQTLNIIIGDQTLTATLYDNPTARDLMSRLPLTVNLSDFGNTEKIFTPFPGLTTEGSVSGMNPKAGDIALYIPWGNIAIYYRDGGSPSNSLIPVGRVNSNISPLQVADTVKNVRFELSDNEEKEDNNQNNNNNEGNTEEGNQESMSNTVEIMIGSTKFTATLSDNATAKAFKALLPQSVSMTELHGNEIYYNLQTGLPTNASNPRTINSGDIMLWGSNCVVIFYEIFSTSYSYTRIGKIDDTSKLRDAIRNNVNVVFKLINQ